MPAHSLISREEWNEVKSVAETGVPLEECAKRFDLPFRTVQRRSQRENWLTPARVEAIRRKHAETKGILSPNVSKEQVIAESDSELSNQLRKITLLGVKSGLETFFATAKAPEDWQTAKIALEMGAKAANWTSESTGPQVQVLFTGGTNAPTLDADCEVVRDEPGSEAELL